MYSNPSSWHSLLSSLHFYTPPSSALRILGSRQGKCGSGYLFYPERCSLGGKRAMSTSITRAQLSSHRWSSQLTFLNPCQTSHLTVIFSFDITHLLEDKKLWLPVMNGKKVDLFRICGDMHDRRTVLFVLLPNYIIVIQHCFMIYDACHLFLLSLST